MSSMGSGRIESGFSEMSISRSRNGSSLGLDIDFDSFYTKPKGFYLFVNINVHYYIQNFTSFG